MKIVKTKENQIMINGLIYHQIKNAKHWFYCGDCNEPK